MKEIIIKANDSGQRLDRFLVKMFPSLSQTIICKNVRNKNIKVNRKRTEISYKLCENDLLQLYISDEHFEQQEKDDSSFLNATATLDVIYEDENVMLVDKPVGLVVHEDESNTDNTLINAILKYLCEKGEYSPNDEQSFRPALCNRIDRNTGGIVIAAKNAETLRILNQKIKDRELEKKYLCVAKGALPKKKDTLTAYLFKDSSENRVHITNKKTPQNRTIITEYTVIDSFSEMSLLEINLLTGRTHQIRAHLAYIGHPLLGDGKYGDNRLNKLYNFKYQALYSYKLRFTFSTPSGILSYLNGKEFQAKNVWFIDKYYSEKQRKGKTK